MKRRTLTASMAVVIGAVGSAASGQTASLYVAGSAEPGKAAPYGTTAPPPAYAGGPRSLAPLSPAIAQTSLAAVAIPEPRQYGVNDLVTIVVRESTQADADSKIDTKKDGSVTGTVTAVPPLNPIEMLQLQFANSTSSLTNPVKVDAKFNTAFKGNGTYERKDTFTTRITARIIDVKPNGTLVLEARKYIKTDDETLDMVVTGTCRKEDIATDNTVLSTQLYDMRLTKEHKGELRKTIRPGWITKLFGMIFNF